MKTACLTAVSRRGVCRLSNASDIRSLDKNRLHFPSTFSLRLCASAVICLLLCSCSMVSGTRHADGRLVVTSWRFLWKSEAVRFTASDTNFVAVLSIGKSSTDDEATAAVTQAVVTGLVKGFVP